MKSLLLVCLLAIMAVAAFGQNTVTPSTPVEQYTPAIIGKAPESLKKPIIFSPPVAPNSPDADAPLTGAPPKNLKKSVVTEHIFGGAVEFKASRTRGGCPCRKQLPEKFRYDTEFKPERVKQPRCPCARRKRKHSKKGKLPPVIAALYPDRNATLFRANATAPCLKANVTAPVVEKIAPQYYPKRPSRRALKKALAAKKAACAKNAEALKKKRETITPAFYPPRPVKKSRKHGKKAKAARKAAKAQRKAARKAKKEARAAKRAAKKAARAAKKAARKAKRDAKKNN